MRVPDWFKSLAEPIASQMVHASQAYVDLKSSLNDMSDALIDFTAPPQGEADELITQAARLVAPVLPANVNLVRVGGANDGGYLMADDFDVVGAVSLGVGPDVSWDQAIAARGIAVAMFDPTVRRPPEEVPQSRFFRLGVRGNLPSPRHETLQDLIAMTGFPSEGDLLLKMDVEASEWESLQEAPTSALQRFRQIVVEFHGLAKLALKDRGADMLSVLEKLNDSHVPIHIHANNFGRLVRFDNYWFPDAIEVSYLRGDRADLDARPASLPSTLDAPCDQRVSDISLRHLASLPPRRPDCDEIANADPQN